MSIWKTLQFAVAGAISIEKNDSSRELVLPPEILLTRKGLFVLMFTMSILLSEFVIREIWAKRKGWEKTFDIGSESVFENLVSRESVANWFDENGLFDCKPNFYEEHVYYKYYYITAKWAHKKKIISYIPEELNKIVETSRKNYVISKLSGIK